MAIRGSRKPLADHDPAAEARSAARRAGLTLGEWLDAVLDESLEDTNKPSRHAPIDKKPLARSALAPNTRDVSTSDRDHPRGGDAIEHRLGRLVSAIGSNAPVSKEQAPHALRAMAERLDRLGGSETESNPARGVHDRNAARDTVRHLEDRLQAIARRMENDQTDADAKGSSPSAPSAQRPGVRPPLVTRTPGATAETQPIDSRISPAPIDGLKEAIGEIASRQKNLEIEFDKTVGSYADRTDHRIDAIAERLEQTIDEASPIAALQDLQREFRDASNSAEPQNTQDIADLRLMISDIAHRIDSVPVRLAEDFAERLEDTVRRLDTATRSEIDSIRGELREIAQDLERSSRNDFNVLHAELARLADKVDATSAPITPDIEAKIEDIATRLDTAVRGEFSTIRDEIQAVTEQIDQSSRNEFEALRSDLKELGDRLSKERNSASLSGANPGAEKAALAELETVRSDIRGIAEQIDGIRQEDYTTLRRDMRELSERVVVEPTGRMHELEQQLTLLTEQLASAARDEDPQALAQIEQQISKLAENVEASSQRMVGISDIEKTIDDLFARMEESRADALEAARGAARDTVDRALASLPAEQAGSEGFDGLREELLAQRSDAETADRRNQDTQESVRDTLKKIVDRLEDLEDEVDGVAEEIRSPHQTSATAAPQTPSQEAPTQKVPEPTVSASAETAGEKSAELDPDDIVGRIDAVARNFRETPETSDAASNEAPKAASEDDTPLAPGTRQPKTSVANTGKATERSVESSGEASGNGRSDFIAAARRAAQAATVEQAGGGKSTANDGKSALVKLRTGINKYRRPLLIGIVVLIVLFAAVKIATLIRNSQEFTSIFDGLTVESIMATLGQSTTEPRIPIARAKEPKSGSDAPKQTKQVRQAGNSAAPIATGSIPDPAKTTVETADLPPAGKKQRGTPTPGPNSNSSIPAPSGDELAIPAQALPDRLNLAANDGDAAAQFEVAVRYMDGRGLPQDYAMAAEWYRKAAAQGLAPAQYRLGSLYEKGQGIDRDLAMARMWYQRAAEQGNRKAMHNLAVLYADGIDGNPDYQKAAMWFRQAAETGLADSQFNLAVLFARGLGVKKDLGESFRWFAIASDQGDGEALQKRDEVARELEEETLKKARAALDAWVPKQSNAAANVVPEPQGGWGEVEPKHQAFVDRDMVASAQALLIQLGYSPGPADGEIGPRTRDAVRAFQRSVGLADTGDITPELVTRLDSAAG